MSLRKSVVYQELPWQATELVLVKAKKASLANAERATLIVICYEVSLENTSHVELQR